MKLVIITSTQLRHKYFINSLAKNFSVVGVIQEEKQRDPSKKGLGTKDEHLVKKYFQDRSNSEKKFFKDSEKIQIEKSKVKIINKGDLNEENTISQIESWRPDYICVFGSSLIGKEIIDKYPRKIINMHLGLSPYYRGSGTNFWPLYEKQPEYVGVTVHFIDEGIDTGEIIAQSRPDIKENDTPHSIGNKTIIKGVEVFIKVLKKIENGEKINSFKQDKSKGRICLFNQCKPKHIIELDKKFKRGEMRECLKNVSSKKVDIKKL